MDIPGISKQIRGLMPADKERLVSILNACFQRVSLHMDLEATRLHWRILLQQVCLTTDVIYLSAVLHCLHRLAPSRPLHGICPLW